MQQLLIQIAHPYEDRRSSHRRYVSKLENGIVGSPQLLFGIPLCRSQPLDDVARRAHEEAQLGRSSPAGLD